MSVLVHAGRLRYEIARRGWAATDLAREARLSQATVGAALSGRLIAAKSLSLIASALGRFPPMDVINTLVMNDLDAIDLG